MSIEISKYISFEEATKSPTAKRLGIDNEPNAEQLLNMQFVAKEIFDPVREFIGGPLLASSFFRSKELNDAVPGSSKTSQHMSGEAIDIDADGYQYGSNLAIFDFIRTTLDFDQCISEYPDDFGTPSWVHVSKKRIGHNRKEVLVKLRKKYIPLAEYKTGMI
jgi:zinc D-Ala-D-Ala carboxypeptidase